MNKREENEKSYYTTIQRRLLLTGWQRVSYISLCLCIPSFFRKNRIVQYFCCLVAKSCPTLLHMDSSSPGSSVHEITQARILEWVAISSSGEYSQPRDGTQVSCIGRQIVYHRATKEARYSCINFIHDTIYHTFLLCHRGLCTAILLLWIVAP